MELFGLAAHKKEIKHHLYRKDLVCTRVSTQADLCSKVVLYMDHLDNVTKRELSNAYLSKRPGAGMSFQNPAGTASPFFFFFPPFPFLGIQ